MDRTRSARADPAASDYTGVSTAITVAATNFDRKDKKPRRNRFNMEVGFPYRAQPNEPSIFVEIYLPKKAHLQGVLYTTLTHGLRRDAVRAHFAELADTRRVAELARLHSLSSNCWAVLDRDLTAEEIAEFPRLFYGYSMYEVDGCSLKHVGDAPNDPDSNYDLVEERTQVIRLVFKYTSADQSERTINYIKAALRDPLSESGSIEENYRDQAWIRNMPDEARDELARVYQWMRYVGWMLYGFVLYRICQGIVELESTNLETRSSVKQDEIWVTSLWNLNVNVITWDEQRGR
jgi:hypothetical protein